MDWHSRNHKSVVGDGKVAGVWRRGVVVAIAWMLVVVVGCHSGHVNDALPSLVINTFCSVILTFLHPLLGKCLHC